MSEKKTTVVVELVIKDPEVARYVERAFAADVTTHERGEPLPLSEALADFLAEAIGPSYPDDPDPEAEGFFDRFHGGDWLESVKVKGAKP